MHSSSCLFHPSSLVFLPWGNRLEGRPEKWCRPSCSAFYSLSCEERRNRCFPSVIRNPPRYARSQSRVSLIQGVCCTSLRGPCQLKRLCFCQFLRSCQCKYFLVWGLNGLRQSNATTLNTVRAVGLGWACFQSPSDPCSRLQSNNVSPCPLTLKGMPCGC